MYKILLCDDDEGYLLLYKQMDVWKNCGFMIAETAINGNDALKKLEKHGLYRYSYADA